MSNRKQRSGAALFIMLLIGIVAGVGFMMLTSASFVSVPAKHQSIIDNVDIVDTRSNFHLTAKPVDSSSAQLGTGLATFELGKSYEHSTWLFQRGKETEWVVTIWGPDDDGTGFIVEFGRVSPGEFDIKIAGESKVTFDSTWTTPAAGYWWIEVTVP